MKKAMWVLACLLLLPGCGGNSEAAQAGQDELAAKYVYQAEYLAFRTEEPNPIDAIGSWCVSGNALYYAGSCVSGTTVYTDPITGKPVVDEETGELWEMEAYETFLFRMDLDSGETARLEGYEPLEVPEGMLGSAGIAVMAAGADGTVWILDRMDSYSCDLPEDFDGRNDGVLNYYVQNERVLALRQYDGDGHLLQSVDISGLDAQYPNLMLVDQDGNFYIHAEDAVYLLDAGGTVLAKQPNASVLTLCRRGGEIGVLCGDSKTGGRFFQPVDPQTGDLGRRTELPSNVRCVYPGVENYEYLYDDGAAVYGWNAESGGFEKLLSWLDCGIDRSSFDRFTMLEDGRIVAVTIDYFKTSDQYQLLFLTRGDASAPPEAQETKTLTLACTYLDRTMSDAILAFNRSHSDVQIVVKDYSEYDGDAAMADTKLSTEILAGNMPDILYNTALPLDQMAAMGMLTDLWPLIDGDESLGREDLMTHLFDVMSTDGKLYQIASGFCIHSAVGNADVTGDRTGWTLDELLETFAAMPEGTFISGETDTKEGILAVCVNQNLESFIDWETRTCSFDSSEFRNILNFANSYPAEFDWTDYDWMEEDDTYGRFQSGKQLIVDAVISSFDDLKLYAALVGGNPCYVGYPSSAREGTALQGMDCMSITAACQNVDLAWSFVRTFLTEEYQRKYLSACRLINQTEKSQVTNWLPGFPTNRHCFDAVVEEQMKIVPEYQLDPETGKMVETYSASVGWGKLEVPVTAMTQEEYDTFVRLYESCGSVYSYNDAVWNIILEEAAPFFDGQKTAEETARIIQDRVSLYVMEQK